MAQKLTEHSRKLRSKTATAHAKKQVELGLVKRFSLALPTPVANELDAICKELALSRPQVIKKLCEMYRESQQ